MKPLRTLANHKGAKKYKTLLDNILVCCWRKTLTTSYGENLPLPSEFQINKLVSVFLFLALVLIRLGTFSLEFVWVVRCNCGRHLLRSKQIASDDK